MENKKRRAILGLVFIIIGTILLLDNFNIIPWEIRHYLFTWQIILIVIGVFQLLTGNKKGAFIMIGLGIFFWIPDYMHIDIEDYWPVILIIIGVGFFLKGQNRNDSNRKSDNLDFIDEIAILSGSKKMIDSENFEGGKVTTVFGGSDLDFLNANLKDGKASLDLFTMFGGFKARVPAGWKVKSNVTCIFGGFEDKRRSHTSDTITNELTIRGLIIFGGGEVR